MLCWMNVLFDETRGVFHCGMQHDKPPALRRGVQYPVVIPPVVRPQLAYLPANVAAERELQRGAFVAQEVYDGKELRPPLLGKGIDEVPDRAGAVLFLIIELDGSSTRRHRVVHCYESISYRVRCQSAIGLREFNLAAAKRRVLR